MPQPRIAAIGAGSFVFGRSLLRQALVDHDLPAAELRLMDINEPVLEAMAAYGRRLGAAHGRGTAIHAYTDRRAALAEADYVTCCAAPRHVASIQEDMAICDELAPGHHPGEFHGVVGIGYALRQLTFLDGILEDMAAVCPEARLINMANPLPHLLLHADRRGRIAYGFCGAGLEGWSHIWRLLTGGEALRYPFAEARARYDFAWAGTNHFTWVTTLTDRETGRDLRPDLIEALRAGRGFGNPMCEAVSRAVGVFLLPNDHHVVDFLDPAVGALPTIRTSWHGSDAERAATLRQLEAAAGGEIPPDAFEGEESWERPVDLMVAETGGPACRIEALNLPNRYGPEGTPQLPGLPAEAIVETPATIDAAGGHAEVVELPPEPKALCARAASVTTAVVDAFEARSRARLREAVELDPTILDKAAGWRAVEAILAQHAERIHPMT